MLWTRICVFVGSSIRSAIGAALLQDHTESWTAAGLADQLVQAYVDVLPPALFEAVAREAAAVVRESMKGDYKFGKRTTWWLPLHTKDGAPLAPRSAIEAAVHQLHQHAFGGMPVKLIVGAEWWVQEQQSHADIGFHYDKDEAFASNQMTMLFPEVSTVTYLESEGGPTLVLNQTTPDGNEEVPETPVHGYLCYPQRNKHLVFRGNLQHGVCGQLSRAARSQQLGSRRTLLVNWWRSAPQPPNCNPFEAWEAHGLLTTPAELRRLAGPGPPPRATRVAAWVPMALDDASTVQQVVEIAPTDLYYFAVVAPERQDSAVHDWALTWPHGKRAGVVGPISRLDLEHRSMTSSLFREKRPKLIVVLADATRTKWGGRLPGWLGPLHRRHGHRLKFVLADPHATADFMKFFGLTAADAPTLVIHDTVREQKHFLKEPMGSEAAKRFINGFLRGAGGGAAAGKKKERPEQGRNKDEV